MNIGFCNCLLIKFRNGLGHVAIVLNHYAVSHTVYVLGRCDCE